MSIQWSEATIARAIAIQTLAKKCVVLVDNCGWTGHEADDRREIFDDLNIHARVQWAKTSRGGTQYDLLAGLIEPTACSSAYGLCE